MPPNPTPKELIYAPFDDSIINAELVEPESLIINAPVVLVGVFILMLLFVKEPFILTSLKNMLAVATVKLKPVVGVAVPIVTLPLGLSFIKILPVLACGLMYQSPPLP